MAIAPLFVKYQTKSGAHFVFDLGTNEIIRIGEVIYAIVDDFRILDTTEMIEKYQCLGEANIRESLAKLGRLQSQGILCDSAPQLLWKAEQVLCQGKLASLNEFLMSHGDLLTLELTQKCNLRCEYCCYGEHYPGRRKHSHETMSLEVAKNAIIDYLDRHPQKCSVGFYGGEPLLEFELLKQVVLSAEVLAHERGVETNFSITTNGTLLNDEKIHFLVQHRFNVAISLDGPKETHDRYRVFQTKNCQERHTGTYEVVRGNMERFVELYPDYPSRSIILTLAATSNFDEINAFLRHIGDRFDAMSGYVQEVPKESQANTSDQALRDGVWAASPREGECCCRERNRSENMDENSVLRTDSSMNHEIPRGSQKMPDFCDWTDQRQDILLSSYDRFIEEICHRFDAKGIESEFPLFLTLFRNSARKFHLRAISRCAARCNIMYKCYPSVTRTFCSTQGVFFPCEKTETGRLFDLGNAGSGVDIERARRLTEWGRCLSDCGNCIAKRSCNLCVAMISEQGTSGRPDAFAFQRECRINIDAMPERLKKYTTVMEMNQELVDALLPKGDGDDWASDIKYKLTEEQLHEIERANEQIEETLEKGY